MKPIGNKYCIPIAQTWYAVRDILFSRGCAGCDRPDEVLCDQCRTAFQQYQRFHLAHSVQGFGMACGQYRGSVRQVILSWKDHDDIECDGPLSDALIQLSHHSQLTVLHQAAQHIAIVPAPSSRNSIRKRGRRQLNPIVRALVTDFQRRGIHAEYAPLLEVQSVTSKSVQTHSARDRAKRVAGHIAVNVQRCRIPLSTPLVIIDDIVTSGATMHECSTVLHDYGYTVLTALALAYTPARRS